MGMGRPKRASEGGLVYHVLNRANGGIKLFQKPADYDSFVDLLAESVARTGTELFAFCVMRNHWHLVVRPREEGELSRFVGWLALTHTQRWHARRQSAGRGHVYQGRFKSFPVQDEAHFLTVSRYVERNALRANLVDRAEQWRWGSLWHWNQKTTLMTELLAPWPVRRSAGWLEHVNQPQTDEELTALRRCINRGCPFGDETWSSRMVKRLGLETTLTPRGRPRITPQIDDPKQKNGS
jgi:putative transposase